jgi:hypothetical protein
MENIINPSDLEDGFSIVLKDENLQGATINAVQIGVLGLACLLLVIAAIVNSILFLLFLFIFALPGLLWFIANMPAIKVIVNKDNIEFNYKLGLFNRKIMRDKIKIENSNSKLHQQAIKISGSLILTRYYSIKFYSINKIR